MIPQLVKLFEEEYYITLLQQKLPRAFEVADGEAKRIQQRKGNKTHESVGQEVGVIRERILVAFLRRALGDLHVEMPRANAPMRDVMVFGEQLEIKTAGGNGKVKAKWTADAQSAQRDIAAFVFTSDLLLVRIWWKQERDSLFYIPVEVLDEISKGVDPRDYISGAANTNNRGIEFKKSFMARAEQHILTTRVPIRWEKSDISIDPTDRWLAYWANASFRDPLYL